MIVYTVITESDFFSQFGVPHNTLSHKSSRNILSANLYHSIDVRLSLKAHKVERELGKVISPLVILGQVVLKVKSAKVISSESLKIPLAPILTIV